MIRISLRLFGLLKATIGGSGKTFFRYGSCDTSVLSWAGLVGIVHGLALKGLIDVGDCVLLGWAWDTLLQTCVVLRAGSGCETIVGACMTGT